MIFDFNPGEGDRLKLAHGPAYRYAGSANVTAIYQGDDVVAYINNVNLGSGLITSATPWVIV